MKTLTLVLLMFLGFGSSDCLSQTPQANGVVRGTVVDELGHPVADATVIAYPADRGFTYLNRTSTEKDGSFTFEGLSLGKYAMAAEKPAAFYANTFSTFSGGGVPLPLVELSPDHPAVETTVNLAGKAAVIMLSVRDPANGGETFACVKFSWALDPGKFLRISKQGVPVRVLVPVNKDIVLTVWYPGYLRQTYRGSLRVNPAEVRNVRINLVNDPAAKYKAKDELLLEEMKHVVEDGCADM